MEYIRKWFRKMLFSVEEQFQLFISPYPVCWGKGRHMYFNKSETCKRFCEGKAAVTASFQFACVKYCWRFTWIYFRCRLPFRPACHHDNSPHTVELPPDPDPVQTDRPLEMLRISWNVAWHGGMEKLLKHLAQSKNSSQKDKITE